ncbi:MAG: hypothetical protein AB1689_15365 [Thermodesulfobacteriota bacterium]
MELSGRTKLLGLIADPVAQARSPALANELLARRGKLGERVFVPMQVPAGASRGRAVYPGLPMLRGQLDAILDFIGAA